MALKLKQSVLEKAFDVTSYFEGGYSAVVGNFDGQGLSLGFLQWNFGQDTLQPLFLRLFNEYPEVAEAALPDGGKWLKDAIENDWAMEWAAQIQVNNQVVDPWKSALYNLCCTEEFKQIQKDAAQEYVEYAINMCNGFGLTTDRAYSLMFDIAVQCGPISTYELIEPTYTDKLEAIANAAVKKSNSKWQSDVGKRKLAIVYGKDLGRGWAGVEFNDENAFEDEITILPVQEFIQEQHAITIKEAIQIFVDKGIIKSPEYWLNAYQIVNNLEALFVKTAKVLKG